jgi:hypothetical protein
VLVEDAEAARVEVAFTRSPGNLRPMDVVDLVIAH